MTSSSLPLEDCIRAFRTSDDVPGQALAAAMAHADALAPSVLALADKMVAGVHLMPEDVGHLYYGLHVLAAARHPGLLERVLAMVRLPDEELDDFFDDRSSITLQQLLLSVWDREPAELLRMIEHADLEVSGRIALLGTLARLTFDGRVARAETLAFLTRIARDNLFDGADIAWLGWEEAVTMLGLVELEAELERVLRLPLHAEDHDIDREETRAMLRESAAAPADPARFEKSGSCPIDDPVAAMGWVERRAAAMAAHADATDPPPEDDDPARADRLTPEEEHWLAGLLTSRQVPATTMPFEMLDGFLTALVIGPASVPPSAYLPTVWGTDDGSGPIWDGSGQAEYALGLIAKHCNAIARRRLADATHRPAIGLPMLGDDWGEAWAQGFFEGVDLAGEAWEPFFGDERTELLSAVLEILSSEIGETEQPVTSKEREALLEQLPEVLRGISRYWIDPATAFPRRKPVRVVKVGRNDPCPCGSGRKYKRCCGASGSGAPGSGGPTVH